MDQFDEKELMDQAMLLNLLQFAVQNGASDIHFQPGTPPGIHIKGDLAAIKAPPVTEQDMMMLFGMTQDPEIRQKIETMQDYDGSIELKNLCRFRINVFRTSAV